MILFIESIYWLDLHNKHQRNLQCQLLIDISNYYFEFKTIINSEILQQSGIKIYFW
jgi:hypothetical protein